MQKLSSKWILFSFLAASLAVAGHAQYPVFDGYDCSDGELPRGRYTDLLFFVVTIDELTVSGVQAPESLRRSLEAWRAWPSNYQERKRLTCEVFLSFEEVIPEMENWLDEKQVEFAAKNYDAIRSLSRVWDRNLKLPVPKPSSEEETTFSAPKPSSEEETTCWWLPATAPLFLLIAGFFWSRIALHRAGE